MCLLLSDRLPFLDLPETPTQTLPIENNMVSPRSTFTLNNDDGPNILAVAQRASPSPMAQRERHARVCARGNIRSAAPSAAILTPMSLPFFLFLARLFLTLTLRGMSPHC